MNDDPLLQEMSVKATGRRELLVRRPTTAEVTNNGKPISSEDPETLLP